MTSERVTGGKINVQYLIRALVGVCREVHIDPATQLPVSGQILPKRQGWGQNCLPISRFGFSGRCSNGQKGGDRSSFGFVQHQLRCDNQITKTGLRWQHIGALKTIQRTVH